MKEVFCFVLFNDQGVPCMTTEVDECDPRIDAEFWNRFLEGDCTMQYQGTIIEEDEDDR